VIAIGETFGRLIVASYQGVRNGKVFWYCDCSCGGHVSVRNDALANGNTKSCGCLKIEAMSKVGKANKVHGLSRSLEYHSWSSMNARCYNAKSNRYSTYGEVGVTVCFRWRDSFESFLADMGKRPTRTHSLDRFPDPHGNYEPNNCRWATIIQQRHNRRSKS
jgi:hypothetical protein